MSRSVEILHLAQPEGVSAVPNATVRSLTHQKSEAIIVTHRTIWSWYTGRWWVGCYTRYSKEGPGRGRSPPRPLLAVPHVTAHPSTASVPITGCIIW